MSCTINAEFKPTQIPFLHLSPSPFRTLENAYDTSTENTREEGSLEHRERRQATQSGSRGMEKPKEEEKKRDRHFRLVLPKSELELE